MPGIPPTRSTRERLNLPNVAKPIEAQERLDRRSLFVVIGSDISDGALYAGIPLDKSHVHVDDGVLVQAVGFSFLNSWMSKSAMYALRRLKCLRARASSQSATGRGIHSRISTVPPG